MNVKFIKGLFAGIVAPVVAFSVYVLFWLDEDLFIFIDEKITQYNLPAIISLSLLINLLIFFMNIQTKRDDAAKGILLATMLYGVVIVFLKFF